MIARYESNSQLILNTNNSMPRINRQRNKIRLLFLLSMASILLVFTPALQAQNAVDGAALLLQNARLIVGDGTVLEGASILVNGDTITAVASADEITIPENVSIVDLTGKTIIPALIDAHAHLGYAGRFNWGAENYTRENLIDNLQLYAYFGFAAVFSAGSDPDELALEIQTAQRSGEITGARFLFAAGMAPPAQGPNNQFLVHALRLAEVTGMTILRGLENPQQARAAVREVAAKGIPFIKLWVDDRNGTQQKLEPALYRAVIAAAMANEIPVFVHQQYAEDMPELLDAGVQGFLHGRLGSAFGADIALAVKQANAFVVPNLGLAELRREAIGEDPFLRQVIPPPVAERLSTSSGQRQLHPPLDPARERELRESFAHLIAAEVDILLGTDAGAIPGHPFGYTGHRELEIFVRLGMTPMQALIAATSKPAQRLGLEDLGLLKVGFSADLVILDSNPLDDIRNTRSIYQVYLRGKLVDREAFISNLAN